jgi:hypothetical protein
MRRTTLSALFLAVAMAASAQTLYWETPQVFVPQGMDASSSAVGRSLAVVAWQEIKPRSPTDTSRGEILLSLAVSKDGVTWKTHPHFFKPIEYVKEQSGEEPRVYSMTVDSADRILVAVAASANETVIEQSVDGGATFQEVQRLTSPVPTGAPNLTPTAAGFLLLVAQGRAEAGGTRNVTIAYSTSRNGSSWTPFAPFVTAADDLGSQQIQASHVTRAGTEYVAFQSLVPWKNQASWQVFMKQSRDGGATWDPALPITSRPGPTGEDPLSFSNERPRLSVADGWLVMVWERSQAGSDRPRIFLQRLDAAGAAPEAVTAEGPARFPRLVVLKRQEYIVYADASPGKSRVTLLMQKGRTWEVQPPIPNTDASASLFPHALVLDNALYLFWENQREGGASTLVALRPLTSVGAPVVKAVDFTPGQPANKDNVTVRWDPPQPPDPSGIKEYRYSWSYDDGSKAIEMEKGTVSEVIGQQRAKQLSAKRDGTWTFSVVALDLAGNLTRTPATVSFVRDATPPKPVSFVVDDAQGNLLLTAPPADPERRDLNAYEVGTNSFTLRWLPAGDKDIAGYTYNLQPGWAGLAEYRGSTQPLLTPPPRVVTTATDLSFANRDNGVYAVTVRAIDRAGNLGAPSTIALALSHYLPFTRVDFVTQDPDPGTGKVRLTIRGRGFTDNGVLRKIYLDQAHRQPPWDMEFDPAGPVTVTDREISGIVLDATRNSGAYRVGLLQQRPNGPALYFTPNAMFTFELPSTVKTGNLVLLRAPWVAAGRPARYALSFDSLIVVLVVLFLGVLVFFSVRRLAALAQEGAVLRAEVAALIEGRPSMAWEERKKRMRALKKRGVGLRLKFTLLMVALVIIIVLTVAVTLGFTMIKRQRETLVEGLQKNANILLDAMAASADTQFQLGTDGFLGANDILRLRSAMSEAVFTTITGPNANVTPVPPERDFVWASDQKEFTQVRAGTFEPATTKANDELATRIVPSLQKRVDTEASKKFETLILEYQTLLGQRDQLKNRTDAASKAKLAALGVQIPKKSAEIDTLAKAEYARKATLEPFDPGSLRPTYLFYKPVIHFNGAQKTADTTFYQGMVRLEVKTDAITRQINDSIRAIGLIALAIAAAAIALGVVGAIIMASITVTPIRRLAAGVAKIRDTEKKETLKDHVIVVKTRDEIGELADTVNTMTQGLVKAALANNELLAGIDVQKRFLPLVKGAGAAKGNTAEEENARIEVYGYYHGAKGVSGDYFDFKKLDENHYALIKCDVAGKGVSAALIMVEVATIFISYFRDWQKRKADIARIVDPAQKKRALQELEKIDSLVYSINDMVEERGFTGRFAALTVCILNTETGAVSVCNAGDTIVNSYVAGRRQITHTMLPHAPAAGTFPSMMVETTAPYQQVVHPLAPGDVLFLHTDGIEESKRKLRNAAFEEIVCDEPGLEAMEMHLGTHKKGDPEGTEEFGTERMDGVLNALFTCGTYRLVRNHNAVPNEELLFDFSTCTGTAQEAVLALISVEKVYRQIPDSAAPETSRVTVDAKVAAFLKEHFRQFGRYFAHPLKDQPDPDSVTFSHAREDDQYDDLTILAVRRK